MVAVRRLSEQVARTSRFEIATRVPSTAGGYGILKERRTLLRSFS